MATIPVLDADSVEVEVELPLTPGRAAAAASRPVVISTEDLAALSPLASGRGAAAASKPVVLSTEDLAVLTAISGKLNWAFDVAVEPTVTAGAYTAGDIIGGLMDFANIARAADELVVIMGVQVVSKAAVVPALTLILFNADPGSTTTTDNAAYSLNAADAFKVIASIPIPTIQDHGTPNSWRSENLGIVAAPYTGARNLKGVLVDATGVTLTATSDIQVRLRGVGA
jgi:hypothetical protein